MVSGKVDPAALPDAALQLPADRLGEPGNVNKLVFKEQVFLESMDRMSWQKAILYSNM